MTETHMSKKERRAEAYKARKQAEADKESKALAEKSAVIAQAAADHVDSTDKVPGTSPEAPANDEPAPVPETPWEAFRDITDQQPGEFARPFKFDKLYQNNLYTVGVLHNVEIMASPKRYASKIIVTPVNQEIDYVSWQDLQRIKDEMFGPMSVGFKLFPPKAKARESDAGNVIYV